MLKRLIFILGFGFSYSQVFSQNVELIQISNADLDGIEINRSTVYNENSLWGYINGGADLYLEYGFVEVLVQDVKWENETFKIEAYRMVSPEAAFGIFSVSKYSCHSNDRIAKWDCINPFQVQAAIGDLFLSIIAYNGTEKSMELAIQIANIIIGRANKVSYEFPAYVPISNSSILLSGVKLISGQLSLQNAYTSIEDVFVGISNFKVFVLPLNFSAIDLIIVSFENEIDSEIALGRFNQKNGYEIFRNLKNSEYGFLLVNTRGKYLLESDLEEIFTKLSK
jgi:hypothetical protein